MTMADNTIYDLLDEINCAASREAVTAHIIEELFLGSDKLLKLKTMNL